MSDSAKIAVALAAFQAEMPIVAKAHTAKVKTKTGADYSYTYADLADITEQAMPILTKHELAFSACPRATERGYELRGVLLHSSGEYLEGALPIAGNTPQEMGSSLTYMRRYLFGCLTGLVTDDDDDGAAATKGPARARKKAAEPSQRPPGSITTAQMGKLGAQMKAANITDRDSALLYVADVIGHPVTSRNELTSAEASRVIDALERDLHPSDADPWADQGGAS
jgi:hypothetical protein